MSRSPKQPRLAAGAASVTRGPIPSPVFHGVGIDLNLPELCTEKKRDWAQLLPDVVRKVADDLLREDVAEYIRLRAVCQPWRRATADPKVLAPRFFPRNWLLRAGRELRRDGVPERLVNVRTGAELPFRLPPPSRPANARAGAALSSRLPEPREYTHHGSTEGLLVLHHTLTDTICLLNPLTMSFTDLPSVASVNFLAMEHPEDQNPEFSEGSIRAAGVVVDVDGVGLPLSAPTVVLSLTSGARTAVVCARPGDNVWRAVDMSCTDDMEGKLPMVKGGLSVRGRFYIPTRTGDVLTVVLDPQPHLEFVARQAGEYVCDGLVESSFLIPSGDDADDGMNLVRINRAHGYRLSFAVHLGSRSLVRRWAAGTTVFLPSVTLQSAAFPSLVEEDMVYSKGYFEDFLRGQSVID